VEDRRLTGTGDTQRESAATACGEVPIGSGRHRDLAYVAIEREIAKRGPITYILVCLVDNNVARA
jgi:hypothetical protein